MSACCFSYLSLSSTVSRRPGSSASGRIRILLGSWRRLHSVFYESNLDLMRFGGAIIIYVLMAAVFCSSFAGVATPCANFDDGSGTASALIQDSLHANHTKAAEKRAGGNECPCCDNCVVACVMSGCNPAAAAFSSAETNYDGPNRYASLVTFLHDGPVLYPPFRPPIQRA
jgi:hypothetical protein